MTKRRNPLTGHGVIDAAFRAVGFEYIAEKLGRTKKWASEATDADRADKVGQLTYCQARTLTELGIHDFAHDLAACAGMALVPLDAIPADVTEVMQKSARLMAESGEAVGTIALALADGKITAAEREEMTRQLLDVKRATAEALKALGGGA